MSLPLALFSSLVDGDEQDNDTALLVIGTSPYDFSDDEFELLIGFNDEPDTQRKRTILDEFVSDLMILGFI